MPNELRDSIITVIDEALKGRLGRLSFYIAGVEVTQAIHYNAAAPHRSGRTAALTTPSASSPTNPPAFGYTFAVFNGNSE
jgi:hypothetical protein